MERENRDERFTAVGDLYAGYTVYDMHYEKIGKVDDLFVDETDQTEYIGVKMGFFGLRSTLVPWELVRVNERRQLMEVSESKERVKDAPSFDDDEVITPELEQRIHGYFGLGPASGAGRGAYGEYYEDDVYPSGHSSRPATTGGATSGEQRSGSERRPGEERTGAAMGGIDRERGESRERAASPGYEGVAGRGGPTDRDIRVQRSEEELRAGTREREAGSVNVRKRVRTDRESVAVPKRREEVRVEKVPVEGREATGAEIGEDEVVVPVVEEEVVVEKRPVVREEIRVRKEVVEDEEVVEADLRKEEIDIDDRTTRRDRER